MIKRCISFGLACFILTGSAVFPLGDFSLTRDLPGMYSNYSKIATPGELGVIDFIGDYLLHGKEIFGHNAHDKPQRGTNNVQFQHQPVPFCVVITPVSSPKIVVPLHITPYLLIHIAPNTSDFKNRPFRPPLAWSVFLIVFTHPFFNISRGYASAQPILYPWNELLCSYPVC